MKLNVKRIVLKSKNETEALEHILSNYDYTEYINDEKFMELYFSVAYNICIILFKKYYSNLNFSEDIIADFIDKKIESLKSYKNNRGSFASWLKTVLYHFVMDYYNKNKSKKNTERKYFDYDYYTDEYEFLKEISYNKELKEYLKKFLSNLKDDKKYTKEQKIEILFCKVTDDTNYEKVANKYNLKVHQIKYKRKLLLKELIEFFKSNGIKIEVKF